MIGVYAIKCISNKKMYIGSSQDVKGRFFSHKRALKRGQHHNRWLQADYDEFGLDDLIFYVLEETTRDSLVEREQFWIEQCGSYNKNPAQIPPMLGKKHLETTKQIISDKVRAAMIGTTHTQEWKDRQSTMMKGNKFASKNVFIKP